MAASPYAHADDSESASYAPMDPPPHAVYSSFDELLNHANAHASTQGYRLVVVRSKTNAAGQKTWVQLACDRHGQKRNTHNLTPETRKKNRKTRRCACPMFCVASKTPGALWELTIRHGEHNHGPYEPPTPKKKKGGIPAPHSSELVELPLLQTPSHCIADFCLVPIGTGNPSVSAEIAEVQRLIKRSGLQFSMSSAGTTVDGPWDDVMRIIGQAHSLIHSSGVARIQTDIRVGTRTDKRQTPQDKVNSVNAHLNNALHALARNDDDDDGAVDDDGDVTNHAGHGQHHMGHPNGAHPNMNPAIAPNLDQMVPPGPHGPPHGGPSGHVPLTPNMNHHPHHHPHHHPSMQMGHRLPQGLPM